MGKLWKDPPFLMGKLWKNPPFLMKKLWRDPPFLMGNRWKDPPFLMGKLWKDPPFYSWVNQRPMAMASIASCECLPGRVGQDFTGLSWGGSHGI